MHPADVTDVRNFAATFLRNTTRYPNRCSASMFVLKSEGGTKEQVHPGNGYPSLDAAIAAAINAGLDLDTATIEKKNLAAASVNDWIMIRIAGGHLGAG